MTTDESVKLNDTAPARRNRYWIGPLLILVALSLYKSWAMGSETIRFLHFFKLDLSLIGLFGILCRLAGSLRPRILRFPVHVVLVSVLVVFATHVVSLVLFDQNLTIQNIVDFAPEWKWDLTFIKFWHVLLFVVALFVYFLKVSLPGFAVSLIQLVSPLLIVAGLFPLDNLPPEMSKYVYDVRDLRAYYKAKVACRSSFSAKEIEAARKETGKSNEIKIGQPRPNIILVMVESLSAVDSMKISGIRDIFPRLDRIAENGMIFTNFFANYYQTNGAFVGLLNQTAPIPFPESKVPMLSAFSVQQSVPRELKKEGYHTEYLMNGPLWFENMRGYAPRSGFEVVDGYDEIERYQGKPTFSCGVPADEWLFEEAVDRAKKLDNRQPYFMTLLTTTSHVPWVDPLKRGNTEENLFDYVDQQLERFYQQLLETGYFEKGVLIISGDHRKPRPVGPREWDKYGETAKARVPLVMLGAGIPKGVIDNRFFQQADLFRRFDDIKNLSKPLSQWAVFVDHYSRLVWQDSPSGNLVVYRPSENGIDSFAATVNGTCFNWTGAKPPEFEKIERTIQVERALHQGNYLDAPETCKVEIDKGTKFSETENGVEARVFEGKNMNGLLNPRAPGFIGKKILTNISLQGAKDITETRGKDVSTEFLAAISVPETGQYWFNVESSDGVCLSVDGQKIIDAADQKPLGDVAGHALLTKGRHVFVLRSNGGNNRVKLSWIERPDRNFWTRSEKKQWKTVPDSVFFRPLEQVE